MAGVERQPAGGSANGAHLRIDHGRNPLHGRLGGGDQAGAAIVHVDPDTREQHRLFERRDDGGARIGFDPVELDDADAAPADMPPHSVLTLHLREEGPAKAAEQKVIDFFRRRTGA